MNAVKSSVSPEDKSTYNGLLRLNEAVDTKIEVNAVEKAIN